jgi:bacteriocin-like protein
MEMTMSKSNDTTKTRELTETELAAVSGGSTLQNCLISGVVAVGGGVQVTSVVSRGTGYALEREASIES